MIEPGQVWLLNYARFSPRRDEDVILIVAIEEPPWTAPIVVGVSLSDGHKVRYVRYWLDSFVGVTQEYGTRIV